MLTTSRFQNLLVISPVVLMVVLLNSDIHITLNAKIDSFIILFGNFIIVYFIASSINKKHKNEELKIDNCFQELDSLLILLSDLRTAIKDNTDDLEDFIIRFDSLLSLQIELIKKYSFINDSDKEKLSDYYYALSNHLTGEDTVDENYKISLLRIEETVLNIKSDIL